MTLTATHGNATVIRATGDGDDGNLGGIDEAAHGADQGKEQQGDGLVQLQVMGQDPVA